MKFCRECGRLVVAAWVQISQDVQLRIAICPIHHVVETVEWSRLEVNRI